MAGNLTDTKVRQARATGKAYKLADGGGLYLLITPTGAKSWRYDYRIAGRRQTLVIGLYPDISLKDARQAHAEARKQVAKGISPALVKRQERAEKVRAAANTFAALAEDWYQKKTPHLSESSRKTARAWLDGDILPVIGSMPLKDVTPADVLDIMRRLETRKALVSAEKVRALVSQIFRHGILQMRADFDPAQALRGAVVTPKVKHHPTITLKELPAFLKAVDGYPQPATRIALRLLLYTFTRKAELSGARVDELDLEGAEWRIPAERMKMGEPHIVPLSRQAVALFKEAIALAGGSEFVFPNRSDPRRPMGPSRLNDAIAFLGWTGRFSPHGARALAATTLNEQGWRPDVIERQLAHSERNKVRAAYNRAEYLEERRRMMQAWADLLDGYSEKVVPLKSRPAS